MLTRTVRIQLLAFVVIAVLGVTYVAVRYVGLTRWFGSGYTVTLELREAGGIFPNAEVTFRGDPVGRVGDMRLTATGIAVDLHIDTDRPIPTALAAAVADRSVIGEQYVDLRPRTKSGPYLHDGSVIPARDTILPPQVQQLLLSADDLATSVPLTSLRTVVDELYTANQGAGTSLSTLLHSSRLLFDTADAHLAQTLDLVSTSKRVLATQVDESAAITAFSRNLALIGRQLRTSDPDLRVVITRGAAATSQVATLLGDVHGTLGALFRDLYSASAVVVGKENGLRQLLAGLPAAVTVGNKVLTARGLNVGLVPTFFDPLPCTDGYGGTTVRTGLATSGTLPLNTSAGCRAPGGSAQDVRGARNAPR